ncbi:hypothetical protein ETB97_000597 [Aspergillus alliaceus]|uniref:Glucose-methanol-choline oxidoreductase N-terminal domain-containing protein n=1 Tax=Petromyces alliaceus TaxID=209559 RepID=A0A8H6A3C6_PETAA|nr:hypothetical protein ETB97_000597 [Aspergillus burnettii]
MATNGSHFDFVIVGSGTAGNTVAGRLAEDPNVTVLILEAEIGTPQEIAEITTPSSAMDLRDSEYDWAYKTTLVKQDDYECIEKPNTRGKTLGGSSSLNYSLTNGRNLSASYHDDPRLYLAELKKIGPGGPIPISHAELIDEMAPFRNALTKAWKSMAKPLRTTSTMRSGSYLFLKDKPNITIVPQVHSKRLIVDEADRTCKGVTVIASSGNELNFYADREVILSQGVFETHKLLILSGVGPTRELSRHGINTIVDSRHVGQNLMDHPGVPFVLRVKDGFGMDDVLMRHGPKRDAIVAEYNKNKSGPIGSGLLELVGFPRIDKYLEKDANYRKAKAANGGKAPFSPYGQPHFKLDLVCDHLTVVVDLVRPISDPGEVTLNSSDPFVQPNINLNFSANDLDIIAVCEGISSATLLLKGDAFKDLVVSEYPWEMPLESEEEMKRAVLDRCQTAFHPTGTARLSKNIDRGVVDPELKVRGIQKLRVADASVITIRPDCRIQNSVYMVGEKCADLIKAEHRDLCNGY